MIAQGQDCLHDTITSREADLLTKQKISKLTEEATNSANVTAASV
jgi:hypothetical protein